MVYMITYDLNAPGKDYNGLYEAIKAASDGTWCHFWESSWLIRTGPISANGVFEKLKPHLDDNDRVLVVEVKNNKQGWLEAEHWDYINNNIFV